MRKAMKVLFVAMCVCWGIANMAFALRHPELTDTQRFLRPIDCLLFR